MMPKSSSASDTPDKPSQKPTKITSDQPTHSDGIGNTIADILDSEYRGISPYRVAMTLLVIAILWTGIKTVQQIQDYHHLYEQMVKLKKDFRQLQIERQRMLIEQQTFSGTPQVTNRAVAELNMFYPNLSDRMIIHANNAVTYPSQETQDTTTTSKKSKVKKQPIDSASQH